MDDVAMVITLEINRHMSYIVTADQIVSMTINGLVPVE